MSLDHIFVSCGNSRGLRTTFNDLRSIVLNALTGNIARTSPALAIGSTKTQVANGAFTFNIGGMPYAKTATAAGTAFTATTHDVADGYTRIFTVQINASGTISYSPGTAVLTANASTATGGALTAANAKMGEVKISADGAIFDATSDDLDDAHLTVVYTNADIESTMETFALLAE